MIDSWYYAHESGNTKGISKHNKAASVIVSEIRDAGDLGKWCSASVLRDGSQETVPSDSRKEGRKEGLRATVNN